MSTENFSAASGTRGSFWFFFLVIAGAALLLTYWIKSSLPQYHGGLGQGETVPVIQAAGWINGEAPAQTPPAGKIRVMHAWFTTCHNCYREAAELVRLHEKYHDQGVEFVGLTHEPRQRLTDVQTFLDKTGITWVNGYGALETLQQMNVEYFPSVWITDTNGTILWNSESEVPLEDAIPLAIAGKLPSKSTTQP